MLTQSGGAYLAARYGLGVLVSLGNMLVLTWWIGPHAYGLFVTAIGLVAFLSSVARMGVDTYLVRRETAPGTHVYDSAGTVILLVSLGLTALGISLAPLLVRWYGSGEFVAPYLVLLFNVPVTALTGIPTAKLEREMNFRRVAGIEVAGQFVGFVAALLLAWRGCGVWAAVAGQTVWQVFILFSTYLCARLRPRLRFDASETRAMLAFGFGLTVSMRAWQLRTLVNPLLVGRFAGAEGVAFVGLAIRIAEALGSVRLAAGRVAIATLARVQHKHAEFRAALQQALIVQVMVLGPLLCAFSLGGPLIVRYVIGVRWMPSLGVYPFIAAGVLVNSVYNLQASALFVTGQQWLVMRSYLMHVVLLAAGTLFLMPRLGINGYGWAELLACAGYLLLHSGLRDVTRISFRWLVPWLAIFLLLIFSFPVGWFWTILLALPVLGGLAARRWTRAATFKHLTQLCSPGKISPVTHFLICACLVLLGTANAQGPRSDGANVPPSESQTGTIPATLFGLHFRLDKIFWPGIPFGSLRLWDTDTRWQNMNPGRGVYNFTKLDRYLEAANRHGLRDVLLTLGSTPTWASADPGYGNCDYSSLAPGDCAPPSDLEADGTGANQFWRDFIYNLGVHLAGLDPSTHTTVSYFTVWNEFTRGAASRPSSWLGTGLQLQRMAQDANCILTGRGVITATGQACTVANMHEPAVGFLPAAKMGTPDAVPQAGSLSRYGAYLAGAGALDSVDMVAAHAYAYRGIGETYPDIGESGLPDQWTHLVAVLPQVAGSLPVWSTEGSWGDTTLNLPDPDMQMGYVARYYLLGWSVGFRRLYWYAADNSWGRLIRQSGVDGCDDHRARTGCPTAAATAWTQVYNWMVGNEMTAACAPAASETVWTCALLRPNHTKMLAVWDASQSCFNGTCSTSAYRYPVEYTRYFTLTSGKATPLAGGTVQIGWKPILLSQ